MTNKDKSLKIINKIVDLANKGYIISFQEDFGEYSLTVGIENSTTRKYEHFHTYQGYKDLNELINSLYEGLYNPKYD